MIARRAVLGLPLALGATAAVDEDIRDVLAVIASALAESNLLNVFAQFDPSMEGLPLLRRHLEALTVEAEVASSIVVLEGAQEGDRYTAVLDWIMEIRPSAAGGGRSSRRRERVRCAFRKLKRKWKITALEPLAFFEPLTPAADAARLRSRIRRA
jgi:hypothetical protein